MTQPAPDSLEQLYADFAALNMEGGWHRRFPALWPEPRRNFLPHAWHYAQVKPILDRAGQLVDTAQAERRNLTMFNPVPAKVADVTVPIVVTIPNATSTCPGNAPSCAPVKAGAVSSQ